jgi:hypothetical protein
MSVPSVVSGIKSVASGITPVAVGGVVVMVVLGIVALPVVVVLGATVLLVVSGLRRRQPENMAATSSNVKIRIPAFFIEFPPVLLEFDAIISRCGIFTLVICVARTVSRR